MQTRRKVLTHSSALLAMLAGAGLLPQTALAAFNKGAFDAKALADAYKGLGISAPAESKAVTLQAPDIAENGAVVPVGVTTTLSTTRHVI